MTDIRSIQDDLAYMRGLADEGRRPSRRGGVILAAGGFLYGLASLAQFAVLAGGGRVTATSAWAPWAPWAAATLVFYAVLFVQLRAIRREKGPSTRSAPDVAGTAWAAMGGAMFTLIVAAAAANWTTGSMRVWTLIPSAFLALYGAGWTVAAAASGRGWMRAMALASFAGAAAIAFVAQSAALWLAYGVALMLLGGAPGVALARDARGA